MMIDTMIQTSRQVSYFFNLVEMLLRLLSDAKVFEPSLRLRLPQKLQGKKITLSFYAFSQLVTET